MAPLEEALATIKDCMEWALQQKGAHQGDGESSCAPIGVDQVIRQWGTDEGSSDSKTDSNDSK